MKKEKKFKWLNEESTQFLKRGYLDEGQDPHERIIEITNTLYNYLGDEELESKFYDYMSRGWISLSSPIWANYGNDKGLPISCFGSSIQDSTDDILRNISEIGMLTKYGGGTASYFGNIRPRGSKISKGGKSNGSVPFMGMHDSMMDVISQGKIRRGAFAAYLPIDHGDIEEFLTIRNDDSKIQSISLAVTIPSGWMQEMIDGDTKKRQIWAKVLKKRSDSGYPYIFFEDNVNENKPEVYKDKGLEIKHSQLCSEIMEYTDDEKTFTCCLSSVNLKYYDDWKDTDLIEVVTTFLDTVLTEFIEKASEIPYLEKAVKFAKEHRSIGLGVLGWHSYLQDHMIPMEGFESKQILNKIFKNINEKSLKASKKLAVKYGEPEMLKGYGERFTTRCVTGDTKVLTREGQVSIKDIVDKEVNVWNGFEYSKVKPYITGEDYIYEVKLSNGKSLKCTDGHIFKVLSLRTDSKDFNRRVTYDVPLSRLREGDVMSKFMLPVIDNNKELKDPYTQGFFTGDGSISNARNGKYPRKEIRLYGDKMDCVNRIKWKSYRKTNYGGRDLIRGYIDNSYKNSHFVPINYSVQSKLDWLAGIIDSDGYASSKGITVSSKYKWFLNEISLMLQTLGCHSYVSKVKRTGGYDSENKYYYVLQISFHSCTILLDLGLNTTRVNVPRGKKTLKDKPNHQWVYVESISKLDKKEMTYCFTEPKNNTGVFNGIMTGQCAIAPTTSSSFILGQVSPSIEPLNSNYFIKDLAKGKFVYKNPNLEMLLEEKGKNNPMIWKSILEKGGSVQHLSFLTDHEKKVFKTFGEISQLELIQNASIMQKYIDQGISLNLMIHPEMPAKEINKLMIEAWKLGIKTLYYQRSANLAQELSRDLMQCISCEG